MRAHPYDSLTILATPQEGMGHSTQARYEAAHTAQMLTLQQMFPDLGFQSPWAAADGAIPWAAGGKWIVTCPCGDYPMASPIWDEARCFNCGAVYSVLIWPGEREEIEAALALRSASLRAWMPGQTAADIHAENVLYGVE